MKRMLAFLRERRQVISASVIVFMVLCTLSILIGNCDCNGCKPEQPIPDRPDASAALVQIDQRVDAAVLDAQHRLDALDAQHRAAIDSFNADQRREYDAVHAQGPAAVEAWMNDWYAAQRRVSP